MAKNIGLLLLLCQAFTCLHGQVDPVYLKAHAVRIDKPEQLSDSAYTLLSDFSVIMFGEMHGTNESAPFTYGLSELFTRKGDTIQVGLEIPPESMALFMSEHTGSSVYKSDFFLHPPYESGKESFAWAGLIAKLSSNPRVRIFFFDMNKNEGKIYRRDSLMYAKIKAQFKEHPSWKMITLSGNYHNRIKNQATMAAFLADDKELNIGAKICSLNMEYLKGNCYANFGHGMEIKELGSYPSAYNSSLDYEKYIFLTPPNANYEYSGFYYTKFITAAKMTAK